MGQINPTLNHCFVRSNMCAEIVTSARQDINDAVGDSIVLIGEVGYSPPPNDLMNKIMIPMAFLLLLIVIIVWVTCYCYK